MCKRYFEFLFYVIDLFLSVARVRLYNIWWVSETKPWTLLVFRNLACRAVNRLKHYVLYLDVNLINLRYRYHSVKNRWLRWSVVDHVHISVATSEYFLIHSRIKCINIIIKFAWKDVRGIWSVVFEVRRYTYNQPLLTLVEKNVHINLTVLLVVDCVTGHIRKNVLNDSRIAENFSLCLPKLFVIHAGQDCK